MGIKNKKRVNKRCLDCGKLIMPKSEYCVSCCRKGSRNKAFGKTPPLIRFARKNKIIKRNKQPERIIVDGKRILLHRYLMEQKIGRQLRKYEIVHHKDLNNKNNNINNLMLMTNRQHKLLHWKIWKGEQKI